MEWTDSVDIAAPAELVWQLTVDVANWPRYVPTVTWVRRLEDGPLRLGSRARIKQPAQSAAIWTVDQFTPGRSFSWHTRRLGARMTGTHEVVPLAGGATRSTLRLTVAGGGAQVLAALFGRTFAGALRRENAGLRDYAERTRPARSAGAPERDDAR